MFETMIQVHGGPVHEVLLPYVSRTMPALVGLTGLHRQPELQQIILLHVQHRCSFYPGVTLELSSCKPSLF